MQSQQTPTKTSKKVAVIGAGAAGLVAARELLREDHQVVVFERNSKVGGVWVYDPATESDALGIDPSRTIIHTSLYNSLRANLPRELIGYRDFPFVAKEGDDRDARRFPGHKEFAHYFTDFMNEFGLSEFIRFDTEVVLVKLVGEIQWLVRSRMKDGQVQDEFFDAVVVCNGHYTKPRVADIPGIDAWPGKQIHSHNYRVPDLYRNKVVIFIGYSASGRDISNEIATVASEVHIATKNSNKPPTKISGHDNIWLHSMVKGARKDGTIVFEDGSAISADIIMHCTGYKFDFPFLDTDGVVTVDDNRVGQLYEHIFPPTLGPWLSFIGLPTRVITFRLFEMQSTWVARLISGKISLPSQEEMLSDVETFYLKLNSAGVPKHYTHVMEEDQFEYSDRLAAHGNFPPLEEWRRQMYISVYINRAYLSENYRDEWEEKELISQAHEDFLQYI